MPGFAANPTMINETLVFDTQGRPGYVGWIGGAYEPRGDAAGGVGWLEVAGARHPLGNHQGVS
jgi:hydroxypyruvate isomerase